MSDRSTQTVPTPRKVHWILRTSVFIASVMTLSLFFAGWRQIHQTGGIADWALLFGGILTTLLLVGIQCYWMYFDEKSKGTLTKRIALFEKINDIVGASRD